MALAQDIGLQIEERLHRALPGIEVRTEFREEGPVYVLAEEHPLSPYVAVYRDGARRMPRCMEADEGLAVAEGEAFFSPGELNIDGQRGKAQAVPGRARSHLIGLLHRGCIEGVYDDANAESLFEIRGAAYMVDMAMGEDEGRDVCGVEPEKLYIPNDAVGPDTRPSVDEANSPASTR